MGKVFWITGLAGAGKTTIGKALYKELKDNLHRNVVFLDGDQLRFIYGNDLGYSILDRKKCAMRNARLCQVISDQEIDVVCTTISMFHDVHEWNRDNITSYIEVFLRASIETLYRRDQKKLYSLNSDDIVGINLNVEFPKKPDITIENNGDLSPQSIVDIILEKEIEL